MLRLDHYTGFIIKRNYITYIKGKKDFTFLKKSSVFAIKVLFIILKLEKFQAIMMKLVYLQFQVMFKTLVEGHENIEERFQKKYY